MYYLFIKKEKDLLKYKENFDRVLENLEAGKTPVYNEIRNANTVLFEAIPYQALTGVFLIIGTFLTSINKIITTNDRFICNIIYYQ
jgi:hypothetical protein